MALIQVSYPLRRSMIPSFSKTRSAAAKGQTRLVRSNSADPSGGVCSFGQKCADAGRPAAFSQDPPCQVNRDAE